MSGRSNTDLHIATQYNSMQYNIMQYNAIQCNAIQCNVMQDNAIQCNADQYNTIKYNGQSILPCPYCPYRYNIITGLIIHFLFVLITDIGNCQLLNPLT